MNAELEIPQLLHLYLVQFFFFPPSITELLAGVTSNIAQKYALRFLSKASWGHTEQMKEIMI